MQVSEITVTLGVTKNLGDYESARIDITNKVTLEEPLELDSKEYRIAHKKVWTALDVVLSKAVSELVKPEEK